MDKIDVLHKIIDVIAGRANLPSHEADELHEALTPGYTIPMPTAEQLAAARAVLDAAAVSNQPGAAADPTSGTQSGTGEVTS